MSLTTTPIKKELNLEDSPYLLDEYGPVFILGCPRSGTTFLSSCITSIPHVDEFVGVLAPPRMMHEIGRMAKAGEDYKEMTLLMRDIFWQSFWRRSMFFKERVGSLLSKKDFSGLFKKPELEGKIFCYKEPFMCFGMEQVAEEFPNAKFIHIIRDGRDNADSMERSYPLALSDETLKDLHMVRNKSSEIGAFYKVGDFHIPWWVDQDKAEDFINHSHYERFIWMWREMVSRVINCGRKLDPSRYIEVRYESVVSDPVNSATKILQFMDEKPSKKLIGALNKGHQRSVGISQSRQSEDNLKGALSIAGRLLSDLGYV